MKKFLAVFALGLANFVLAAPTMSSTGEVTGTLELNSFMGMAGLVVVASGAMWAVKRGLGLIRG